MLTIWRTRKSSRALSHNDNALHALSSFLGCILSHRRRRRTRNWCAHFHARGSTSGRPCAQSVHRRACRGKTQAFRNAPWLGKMRASRMGKKHPTSVCRNPSRFRSLGRRRCRRHGRGSVGGRGRTWLFWLLNAAEMQVDR